MSDPDDPPNGAPSAEEREKQRAFAERRLALRASAMGIQFAVSIGIGAFIGHWLDKRFDTAPTLLMIGVLLGAAAAFRDLVMLARRASKDE